MDKKTKQTLWLWKGMYGSAVICASLVPFLNWTTIQNSFTLHVKVTWLMVRYNTL